MPAVQADQLAPPQPAEQPGFGCLPCRLTNLRRLSLQSNRLSSMRGVGQCLQLRELYLSHNGIQKLEASCGASCGLKAPELAVCRWAEHVQGHELGAVSC